MSILSNVIVFGLAGGFVEAARAQFAHAPSLHTVKAGLIGFGIAGALGTTVPARPSVAPQTAANAPTVVECLSGCN